MEPYPEDSDRKQVLSKTAEMILSAVPVVGSPLQVAFNELAGRRLADRRTAWLNDLAETVNSLEDQIGDFAKLTSEDAFMDALTTASQIADRTSRAEKLDVLRNAVVNSVMPHARDIDAQQLFFDMIERFTVTHVRMLRLFSDPPAWFECYGLARASGTGRVETVKTAMPELAGREDLINRYTDALSIAGLIDQPVSGGQYLSSNELAARLRPPRLTPLGMEFLAFVSDPESKIG